MQEELQEEFAVLDRDLRASLDQMDAICDRWAARFARLSEQAGKECVPVDDRLPPFWRRVTEFQLRE
jgi:hypothetical protein